jgi:uncharacterized protein with von Willebrand factor type A (vWA) domain
MSLEFNKTQVIFALDRSGSMREHDAPGNLSRLAYAEQRLIAWLPEVLAHDADGPSLYAFDDRVEAHQDIADTAKLEQIIRQCQPRGSTDTARVIEAAFNEHVTKKNAETLLFLLTDGVPNSPEDVTKEIVSITNRIEAPEQFRIMILVVGQPGPEVQKWLEDLDDNLGSAGAKFDIVGMGRLDTYPTMQDAGNALMASTTADGEVGDQYQGIGTQA